MALNNQIISSIAANLEANAAGGITGANIANITSNLQTLISNNGTAVKSVSIQSSTDSAFTANYTLTLPVNDGSSGQVLITDGSGVLSWSNTAGIAATIANGNSNVNIPAANGNVDISAVGNTVLVITGTGANITGYANVTGTANVNLLNTPNVVATVINTGLIQDGNSNVRIAPNANVSISANGASNVVVVSATGANIVGTANVSGNANVGNLGTTTAIITTGNITTVNTELVQNGNSNVAITANANITLTAKSNATMVISDTGANITGTANVSGNANVGNLGTTTAVITTGNISTVNTGLVQNGNSNLAISANANITLTAKSNATMVISDTGANITGTANVSGTANVGNLNTSALSATGNVDFTTSANVSLGAVGNVKITGGSNLQYLQTDGAGNLTWASVSGTSISNGNSNVSIAGNANITIASNGVANVVTVTNGNLITGNGIGVILTSNNGTAIRQVQLKTSTNAGFTANYSLTLPVDDGTSGQYLQTDGTGVLSWASISGTTSLVNGNSNVVVAANGAITMGSNGIANAFTVNSDNAGQLTTMTAGPYSVSGNTTVTDASVNNVTVDFSAAVSAGNVYAYEAPPTNANGYALTYQSGSPNQSISANLATVAAYNMGTGDWTLEGWYYLTSAAVNSLSANPWTTTGNLSNVSSSVTTLKLWNSTGYRANQPGFVLGSEPYSCLNTDTVGRSVWFHVAWVRSGTTFKMYLNGNVATVANSTGGDSRTSVTLAGTEVFNFGSASVPKVVAPGRFSRVYKTRLSNTALYTANFSPSPYYGNTSSTVFLLNPTNLPPFYYGNINTGNIFTTNLANFSGNVVMTGPSINLGYSSNISILGGNSGYLLSTDGNGFLSWTTNVVSVAGISNGTSNVNIPDVNGNVNISASANANVLVVTGEGANVVGYVDVTGNFSAAGANVSLGAVGNLHITGGSSGQLLSTNGSGGLSWISPTAGSSISNGNSNISIASNANITLTAKSNSTMVISDTGANVAGYANITGNVIAPNFVGALASGNSNISISANANITLTAKSNSTMVISDTGANVAGYANITGNANVGGNLGVAGTGVSTFAGNINMNGKWVGNIGYAVADTDAASKLYVDTIATTGITYHDAVNAATTTTLATATGGTTAYNQPNGAGNGIGSYISTTGSFTTIDGVTINGSTSIRILVKNEANAAWNGVYNYTNATAITRSSDADEYGSNSATQISLNDYFFTQAGTVNAGAAFIVSAPAGTITFGTSDILFSTFSTSQVYTAGTGIAITGTVISANASQTQITAVGTLGSLSVTGNTTSGNFIGIFANGNSNVSIPSANGNVNISAVGNSNVLVITGTGANITGTLNANGNANLGNLGTTTAIITTGNITTVNTGLVQNGNSNITISASSNVTISAIGNSNVVTVTGSNVILANAVGLTFTGNNGTNLRTIGLKASTNANFSSNFSLSLPPNVGTSGQFLQTDGSGNMVWAGVSGGTQLVNGTSNIVITLNSNITMSSGGVAPIFTVTPGGAYFNGDVRFANSIYANVSGGIVGTILNGFNSSISIIQDTNGNIVLNSNGNNTMTITSTGVTVLGNLSATNLSGNYAAGNSNIAVATNGNITLTATSNSTMVITDTKVIVAGQITSNGAGNLSTGGGQLYLNGTGNNRIDFNTNGLANPSFTTRSAGQKITLYPQLDSVNADYAIGVNGGAFWFGLPQNSGSAYFKWYGGIDEIANLTGSGNFTAANVRTAANGGLVAISNNGTSTQQVTLKASTSGSFTANYTLTLPVDDGTSGQYLQTDGSGVLSWASVSGGSSITNGTSNVSIPSTNGNITISASGTANVLVVTNSNVIANQQITSTRTGSLANANGQLYLNGTNHNRIDFNDAGQALPSNSTRSQGTKITLSPALTSTTTDYAIGVAADILWFSIPGANQNFKWYSDVYEVASLSTSGDFIANQHVTTISSNNTANAYGAMIFRANNGSSTKQVQIKAYANDSAFSGDYTLLLPTNYGTAGQVLTTNGANPATLSWSTVGGVASIANGNSNVNIPAANGNVNITAVGNTTLVVTGTGANIAGYANITGNANVGGIANITGNANVGGIANITGNIIGQSKLFVGTGGSSLTNPVAVFQGSGASYTQLALYNSVDTGSADMVTYGNNGDDTQSWTDMGFTGNNFSDANYTVTAPGDGYLFVQGNSSFGGNLVIATGNTGTTKDIVFATGGFLTGNIKARLYNGNGLFNVSANISATNFLGNLVGAFANGNSNISITSNANVAITATSTTVMNISNVTVGVTANVIPSANATYGLGNSTNYFSTAYIANLTATTTVDGTDQIGFRNVPILTVAANANTVLTDSGKAFYHASGAALNTITIAANANVNYANGTVLTFINLSANALSIACGDTMTFIGNGATGTRTLANNGMATAIKVASTAWVISGSNIT